MKIFIVVFTCLLLVPDLMATATNETEASSNDFIIIARIAENISQLKSSSCRNDLKSAVDAFRERKPWAVSMFDASVKSPVGVENGVEYQFGNFDECLQIATDFKTDGVDIQPKYCLADVTMDGYVVRKTASRNVEIKNSTIVHWGVCLPASCSNEDINLLMKSLTRQSEVNIDSKKCQVKETSKFSGIDLTFGFTILSFLTIVTFSTMYHIYVIYTRKTAKLRNDVTIDEIAKSFSIIANAKKLVKESKDELGLSCVNGIKAVSMFCIISGHALVFMVGGPVQNTEFYQKESVKVQNAFLQNSPLLVDSFLLLSGFLFARLVLIEMDKRRGKINFGILYIFRYIRLTPAYLAMIGLYSTWFIRIGDGPLWKHRISLEQERCQHSWWKNILYINNYYGNDELCMFQSWYLATDTQLFILAPLLIYPLWKSIKLGSIFIGITTTISVIIPFYVTFTQKLDPTFIVWPSEITDLSANTYFINTYGKTHMRATGYIFGILAGFLAFYVNKKQITISNRTRNLLWILTSVIGIYSMYSVTLYYIPTYRYSVLESALYNSLHRLGWSVFTAWVVFASVTSEDGALKSFLSSRALVPLSRLTYCAYLTNGFIELYMYATIRTPKFMSVTNLLGETLSHVCLTFLAALVLCLLFESPIHGMEKMLLRRSSHVQSRERSSESDEFNVNSSRSASTSEISA
ncbi:CLUMA_CG001103, isoform A [Clunio marinus]|uniref:CLUMA_CG001103, isoform A n=1 Tax=Clunio marinus TaxID=568069 RepID=A0A1J1HH25_9DIPT|nr:CLUMA_CG001103, isoform A [Clunio marinus]